MSYYDDKVIKTLSEVANRLGLKLDIMSNHSDSNPAHPEYFMYRDSDSQYMVTDGNLYKLTPADNTVNTEPKSNYSNPFSSKSSGIHSSGKTESASNSVGSVFVDANSLNDAVVKFINRVQLARPVLAQRVDRHSMSPRIMTYYMYSLINNVHLTSSGTIYATMNTYTERSLSNLMSMGLLRPDKYTTNRMKRLISKTGIQVDFSGEIRGTRYDLDEMLTKLNEQASISSIIQVVYVMRALGISINEYRSITRSSSNPLSMKAVKIFLDSTRTAYRDHFLSRGQNPPSIRQFLTR